MTQEELLALLEKAAQEEWTELGLVGKDLTELPPEIGNLTHLEKLTLGKWDEAQQQSIGNQLTELPKTIQHLQSLKYLSLGGNQFTQVPAYLGQLSNLQKLWLNNNQISEIPESFAQLFNLQELYLFENKIKEIPDSLAQLSNLQWLYFHNNKIREIPDSLAQLSNLQELTLFNNKIREIPDSLAQLSNLQWLSLYSNQIREIPDSLAQLSNLQTLNLSNNQIREIPDSLAQLSNLQKLILHNNQISIIPDSLAQLSNLQRLDLDNNQISTIPDSLAQLSNLQWLDLDNNQISTIPDSLAQLSNLQWLDLDNNQISTIPDSLAQLSNLQSLILHNNQISTIPDSLAQLSNLQSLTLHNNQISTIPDSLAQLSNLQRLYLTNNQIKEIPDSIAQLSNLQKVNLRKNKISEIPAFIAQLPNLETLDLRLNPVPISPEILGPTDLDQDPGSIEGIFNYLNKLRNGKVKPLNEAKLLLVGQGSVGKTSLVKRLLDNQFNVHEPQTDGLRVRNWNVHVNSKDVRLNVWDFGGQEIYHATHQFFLTKRSLYLLVCNCRTSEEENRLEYWLKLIQSFGGESPVIIVGNKKDEQPLDINRTALKKKYPNICAIVETSCFTGNGIDELREAIRKEVGKLRDVYNLLPLSWFEVKEQLEAMEKDFISYNEYISICCQNQIPEEQNHEQLIDLLHNLGLVLNFRDHPILNNTNVLNPDWVTQGIYALLSDETLKTKTKGILTYADLSRILDSQKYPAKRHNYLIELMKEEKFQLCFALPHCPYSPKFLIPGLLPKEEAKDIDLEGNTLEFQYHYRILPASILSRFIVLSHEKIHNHIYWRSGVMLAYGDNEEMKNIARIQADLEEKKIFISINGYEKTCRNFLAIIRETFTKIHRSFSNLEVTEWVPVPEHPDHPPLDYQELLGLESMGEREYPIGKLRIKVNLRQLLDGYEPLEQRQKSQFKGEGKDRDLEEFQDRFQFNFNMHQNQGDNQPVANFTNHNEGANIANFVNEAKDNVQVTASNFSQVSGTSTAELLKIIETLRQTVTQFPQETQEDIVIDIDDVEEEIKKPENKRNIPRLKKRLTALVAAASVIAGTVAGANEFASNVIDLAGKVGIELPLPPAP